MRIFLDESGRCTGFTRDPLSQMGHDIPPPPSPFHDYVWDGGQWIHSPLEISPPSLDSIKAAKISLLSARCEAEISGGFTSNALGSPHSYSSKIEDQINLMGVMLMPGEDLILYVCTDGEGVKMARPHTRSQIQQVYADGVAHKSTNIYKFHALRAAVEAATTEAELEAINWD